MSCSVPKSNSFQNNYFYITNIQAENAKNTLSKDIKSIDAVACTYNHLGYVFYVEGNYIDAQENQQKALELFKNCYGGSHPILAGCYNALGLIEAQNKNFDNAETHYQMGLNCLVKYDDTDLLSTLYLNLGNLLNEKGDLKNAKEYFDLSLIVETKIRTKRDNSVIANLALKLGLISEKLNLLEDTKEYFELALDNYVQMNETTGSLSIVNSNMHLGNVCFSLKQFSEALKHFKKVKEMSEVINDKQYLEHIETMIRKCEENLNSLSSNDQTYKVMTMAARNTEKNALSKCTIS